MHGSSLSASFQDQNQEQKTGKGNSEPHVPGQLPEAPQRHQTVEACHRSSP